jgi:hypothetical protein
MKIAFCRYLSGWGIGAQKTDTSSIKNAFLGLVTLSMLGTGSAYAAVVDFSNSNFTTLTPTGDLLNGGANDVVGTWDGSYDTDVNSTNFSRMALSSVTPWLGLNWAVHHVRVFGPGTYTIDSTCTVAQLEAGISACNNPLPVGQAVRFYEFTVGPDQIGGHMLFNWNQQNNIDIISVWSTNAVFGPSPLWTIPPGSNSPDKAWYLMSTDGDGDGINGISIIETPFIGFSFNFNLSPAAVPVPGAIWLFGSGLVGLITFARKRETL